MEVELLSRLKARGVPLEVLTDPLRAPFYHLYHERVDCEKRQHNDFPNEAEPHQNDETWGTLAKGEK
jgi:hypothetical protein